MKTFFVLLLVLGFAVPASAGQDAGRGRALEELSEETQEAFRKLLEAVRPGLEALLQRIDELTYYEAPEILPNGDIIIRRKKGAPPIAPDEPIDL